MSRPLPALTKSTSCSSFRPRKKAVTGTFSASDSRASVARLGEACAFSIFDSMPLDKPVSSASWPTVSVSCSRNSRTRSAMIALSAPSRVPSGPGGAWPAAPLAWLSATPAPAPPAVPLTSSVIACCVLPPESRRPPLTRRPAAAVNAAGKQGPDKVLYRPMIQGLLSVNSLRLAPARGGTLRPSTRLSADRRERAATTAPARRSREHRPRTVHQLRRPRRRGRACSGGDQRQGHHLCLLPVRVGHRPHHGQGRARRPLGADRRARLPARLRVHGQPVHRPPRPVHRLWARGVGTRRDP